MLIQKVENAARVQVEETYAKKFLEYKDVIEVEYSANYLDCDYLIKVSREPSGMYFVHYAVEPKRLSVEPSANSYAMVLRINGTVTTLDGRTVYQFEKPITMILDENRMKTANVQPLDIHDMFPLVPGTYKLAVLVKNEVSKEFMSFEQTLLIPGDTPVLQMTSPVLGFQATRADASRKTLRPFQIGPFEISTQPMRVFTRKDTLAVAFQVFGLSEAQKRSGQLKFVFTRNGQTALDRSRALAECPDLPDILTEFSLADFAAARYSLRISLVADGREQVAGTEEFDVSFREGPASAVVPPPSAWPGPPIPSTPSSSAASCSISAACRKPGAIWNRPISKCRAPRPQPSGWPVSISPSATPRGSSPSSARLPGRVEDAGNTRSTCWPGRRF